MDPQPTNTRTDRFDLLCLVEGLPPSRAFEVEVSATRTVAHLKKLIKTEQTPAFDDITVDQLALWSVSISLTNDDNERPIVLKALKAEDKKELSPGFRLFKVLPDNLPDETIHIIGCGKTRSVFELLCLQWGFYFNAAKDDYGSGDLSYLADGIDAKMQESGSNNSSASFTHTMAQVLLLSRLMVLDYCLGVPGSRQTFSSSSWAILQVCPTAFNDVFLTLFIELFSTLKQRAVSALILMSIVSEEFESVQGRLIAHDYPNFTGNSKLRLIVDEAQILSNQGNTPRQLFDMETEIQPLLFTILEGLRCIGVAEGPLIVYCGTGLSVLIGSNSSFQDGNPNSFPYFEFPGWTSREDIQSYVNRVKEQLPGDESRKRVDALIPPAAIDMLYERLTGRFGPIVSAIEDILSSGDQSGWRLETRMAHFTDCTWSSSIKEVLKLYLYRHRLLGVTELVLPQGKAELVEAAFGRVKLFEQEARIVLDEPFVLQAILNYYRAKDPFLLAAWEGAPRYSSNPAAHGNVWEAMMPPVFVEAFKNRPLSS
ncbi:hypothetical protein BGX23_010490 [Mortierella sp. AD031]|nr:hypothetical protein BGX23_010490 [Mortierella sp. AD031]KAG0204755.1 hypothetical protein BGX33_008290 [Mortierella sp. NVP41]